jgi:hypothetical protein
MEQDGKSIESKIDLGLRELRDHFPAEYLESAARGADTRVAYIPIGDTFSRWVMSCSDALGKGVRELVAAESVAKHPTASGTSSRSPSDIKKDMHKAIERCVDFEIAHSERLDAEAFARSAKTSAGASAKAAGSSLPVLSSELSPSQYTRIVLSDDLEYDVTDDPLTVDQYIQNALKLESEGKGGAVKELHPRIIACELAHHYEQAGVA